MHQKQETEKYSAEILETKLQKLLGIDTTLDKLLKPCLITALIPRQNRGLF